jgi:asparagine N-glycosylation enzyme membrane subunit Stt3
MANKSTILGTITGIIAFFVIFLFSGMGPFWIPTGSIATGIITCYFLSRYIFHEKCETKLIMEVIGVMSIILILLIIVLAIIFK